MRTLPTTARFLRVVPLAAAAGVAAFSLLASTGAVGALLIAASLLLAGGLAVWMRSADQGARIALRGTVTAALLCVPALLVVFFSFSSGGFFPASVAVGDVVVAAMLLTRLALADRPFAAFGRAALVPLVGLLGLAGWALLSQLWSHAPGRATVAFDRDLLYALTFALFASVGVTRERLTWALRGVALVMAAVAAVALLSRLAPDVLATTLDPSADGRLAYPLTYWNALGVFCAIAAVLCLHLTSSDERPGIRVAAAGALPIIGATALLTYSRGGLAAAVIGLACYALLGRPRGLLSALVATVPTTAIAIKGAYDATLISSVDPTTPAAVHQGHHLGLVVLACVVAAVVLRALLLLLDRHLEGDRSPIDRYRRLLRATALGTAAAAIVAALALGAPGAVKHDWDQFVDQQAPAATLLRNRLSSTSNDGRIELWNVALNAFRAHPIDGTGADTFEILYYEHRSGVNVVINAHSLYIETLSDLGVVGLALVLLFVLGSLIGLAPLRRSRDRALYAALFGAGLAWSIHAGVDWDWQMPAASLWFAALGGLALGRGPERWAPVRMTSMHIRAFVVGAALVGAAVFPALVLASQERLSEATTAYAAGNCTHADKLAQRSIDVLDTRAGPWQIEALCDIRQGEYRRAQTALRGGLAVDPNDWQLAAALAASTAAMGVDARAEAALALRLNPDDPGVQALARGLAFGPSPKARAAALTFLSGEQSLIVTG